MSRWLKCTSLYFNTDWNKYDDRLMKAVERGEVDKVSAVLSKKGIIPTKLDVEGRSAFHLAASRGHLDCLNLILNHGVDITATDATGKSALHLAARNAQSLCVQKLLQHSSPVGNVDLQGKTALHDAVMAGCYSCLKLLCDSGASVNTSDFDGRTPLVLATQMSHPRICQLLLERGADIRVRDKQHKTALILGCEYGCKEAVEVLLKNGADVTAVDSFNHDSYHYARLTKNPELVSLIKSYLDNATKAKETVRVEPKKRQEKSTVEDIHKEKEQLKRMLSAKDRGACATETGRVQQRSYAGDHVSPSVIKGKDNILVRQSQSLDSAQILQSPSFSVSRPLELPQQATVTPSEVETLHKELRTTRKQLQAAQEEVGRLQATLTHKSKECEDLVQSRDSTKRDADRQIQELEGALGDVQKRMLDSEAKVKQLQAHVVAVKEHLSNQAVDDLKAQLGEVKVKYEGASAEVGRVRNHLKQSEKALEEYKKSERLLAEEVEKLTEELISMKEERNNMVETLSEMESRVKQTEGRLVAVVPGEKFDNMKNLLTNAVDEKERQLAELREDYDRVLEEVAELHRQMDSQDNAHLQEHEKVRTVLEEQNTVLKKKLTDVTSKCQSLIREVEEAEDEREMLREELQELTQNHEEMKNALELALEEMKDQLEEATARGTYAEQQLKELLEEKVSVEECLSSLKSAHIACEKYESEVAALSTHSKGVEKDLDDLQRKYKDKEKEFGCLAAQNEVLKQSIEKEFVKKEVYAQMQVELSDALEKAKADIQKLENNGRVKEKDLRKVKEESATLKENMQKQLEQDFVSLVEHEAMTSKLNNALAEAESRFEEALSKYQSAQGGNLKLHKEMEEQKKELDTIHEAVKSKFVPVSVVEEKEKSFNATLKDLRRELAEMEGKYKKANANLECLKEEKDAVKLEMESVQQKVQTNFVSTEKYKEVEDCYKGRIETLSMKLVELEQQYMEVTVQRAELEEQNSLCTSKMENLHQRLESEFVHKEKFEAMQDSLITSLQEAQSECERLQEAYNQEVQRVRNLDKELQSQTANSDLLSQNSQAREALEKEVTELRLALREEEETSAQRAEDVATLQAELLRATHALDDLRIHEAQVAELQAEKQKLEEELSELGDRLLGLEEQLDELYQEAAQAKEGENMARLETETLQAKSDSIEKEIQELKERYDDSLNIIGDLQKRIQTSAEQTEAKDKRITELLADVERLKQALNGLSQLAYNGNTPNKRNAQHIDALQAQIKSLQQQLADAERQHREVVSIYRTHLLSAAQGHMDEDVQAALLQIIRMRQQFVC
ncbi:uveal autoantigen with coiled-coil domains and ankyrin repeats isoform X2 [Trichomycterus rosablanca]|uniref:uveal autoantigen with coiled-coil domains and ankyrin repeats isoform X2 n=1 Tax=Trichomycterus rosablanca TaxID=2290929 RepID=UPI002F354598